MAALTFNDPEEWRPVVGWEGFYEVSDLGRVRSIRRVVHKRSGRATHPKPQPQTVYGCILKPHLRNGYETISLKRPEGAKIRRVHILVLEAFVGQRPPGTETRHLDGIRNHNLLTNLVWGTPGENAEDRRRHGTMLLGRKAHRAKITEEDAAAVKALYGIFITGKLAARIGVGDSQVRRIALRNWRHVPPASWAAACAWYACSAPSLRTC